MKREERIQLENLSKLVYGSKSKYQKLVNKGKVTDLEEKLEDGTVRRYKGIMRLTLEDVKESMKEILEQRLQDEKNDEKEKVTKASEKVLEQHSDTFKALAKIEAQEKALNEMVVESQKLGLYND